MSGTCNSIIWKTTYFRFVEPEELMNMIEFLEQTRDVTMIEDGLHFVMGLIFPSTHTIFKAR